MELVDGNLIFSATDLINHLECPHLTQLDIEVARGQLMRLLNALCLFVEMAGEA
jgi:hypothetical protein